MRSAITPFAWLPLVATAVLVWPHRAQAQAFFADYGLSRPVTVDRGPSAAADTLNLGQVHMSAALQTAEGFSGAGLSLEAGRNWFGQIAVGRSLQHQSPLEFTARNALSISGGYRWNNGQSLSLNVTGGREPHRLGLSVSYDWPHYFVRLSFDSKLNLVLQETLRFSAGMRF